MTSIVLTDDPILSLEKGKLLLCLYNGAGQNSPSADQLMILRDAKTCFDHYRSLTSNKYEEYNILCELITATVKLESSNTLRLYANNS